MKKYIFVCTGNTCRSPMAEALANLRAAKEGLDIHFESAGLAAVDGMPATDNAIKACERLGADLSGHISRQLSADMLSGCDRLLVMTASHAAALADCGLPVTVLGGGIADPFGGNIAVYNACCNQMIRAIDSIWGELND